MRPLFLVYLAGPIRGLTYDQSCDWREYTIKKLPEYVKALSPMRGKEFLKDVGKITGAYANPLSTESGITCRDRFDVKRSDVVLMNLLGATQISIGSMIEVGWADAYRKPLIIAMEKDNIHSHPIVNGVAGFVVPNLDEAISVVINVLG